MGYLYKYTEIKILSPLKIEECIAGVCSKTPSFWKSLSGSIVGKATVNNSVLLRKRGGSASPLQVGVVVLFKQADDGTVVTCKTRINGVVIAYVSIWLFIFIFAGGSAFSASIVDLLSAKPQYGLDAFFIVVFVAMFLFSFAVYAVARWLAKRDVNYLLDFVEVSVRGKRIIS